jgi:hypothetical protein
MTIAPPPSVGTNPAALTDGELQNFVASPVAGCADTGFDPDEWYPIAAKAARARAEAARALTVCAACPVRAECLELSLRTWSGAGQHGIWGGLVEADRNALRREWQGGVPVTALLSRVARARLPAPPQRSAQQAARPGQDLRRIGERDEQENGRATEWHGPDLSCR